MTKNTEATVENSRWATYSTFQLARAAQWEIKGLKKKMFPEGQLYVVTLNGVTMKATEARKMLIAHIEAKQSGQAL